MERSFTLNKIRQIVLNVVPQGTTDLSRYRCHRFNERTNLQIAREINIGETMWLPGKVQLSIRFYAIIADFQISSGILIFSRYLIYLFSTKRAIFLYEKIFNSALGTKYRTNIISWKIFLFFQNEIIKICTYNSWYRIPF